MTTYDDDDDGEEEEENKPELKLATDNMFIMTYHSSFAQQTLTQSLVGYYIDMDSPKLKTKIF